MDLPELMYTRLESNVVPKLSPLSVRIEGIRKLLRKAKYYRMLRSNELVDIIRPLSFTSPIKITGCEMSGYRGFTDNVYVCVVGDKLSFKADFKNTRKRIAVADLEHNVDNVVKKVTVLFMPEAPYSIVIEKVVDEPAFVKQTVKVRSIFGTDVVNKTYPVGLFDYRPKPVSEFPVSGADNAVLDISYDWSVGNLVYPTPPDGISITNMRVSYTSGFITYEGRVYKSPLSDNVINIRWTIRNDTGYDLTIRHWGLLLSVLYEDLRHVSQVIIDVSVSDRSLPNGGSQSYSLTFSIPEWAYGMLAPTHAVRLYRGETLFWAGGPLYQFEVGRVRLP